MSRGPKLASIIPALILAVVAITQIAIAINSRLSPWKGGGFGMFSTVRSPDMRRLAIHGRFVDEGEELKQLRVRPDDRSRSLYRIKAWPRPQSVGNLFVELESLNWVEDAENDVIRSAKEGKKVSVESIRVDEITFRESTLRRDTLFEVR